MNALAITKHSWHVPDWLRQQVRGAVNALFLVIAFNCFSWLCFHQYADDPAQFSFSAVYFSGCLLTVISKTVDHFTQKGAITT